MRNGTVSLVHARGVMPDGLAFRFPDDPLPASLDFRELFSPTHDSHVVLLAIPTFRPREPNCALEPKAASVELRYQAAVDRVPDETTVQEEKPVTVARKNFRLVLDAQATPEMVTLPLARVRRDSMGSFIYDPTFVPPCVQIGASPRLMELLGRLVELLDARADSILSERTSSTAATVDYASRQVASFWLSHTIHSSLPSLRHLLEARTAHPEQLYTEMARLAGGLCTFAMHSDPRTLPLYDHDALGSCFEALDRHIRGHLEIILPTQAITIPLGLLAGQFYGAPVTDPRALGRSHWYLGVRSSSTSLAVDVPRLVKLCSGGDDIKKLVERGLPGAPLEHVPSPPSEISPRIGTQYFRIARVARGADGVPQPSPCWIRITQTSDVGVHVPMTIPDVELDLCVVLDGG